jgi:hypothetical protein
MTYSGVYAPQEGGKPMYQNKITTFKCTDIMPDNCQECVCSESGCDLPMKNYPHHDEIKKAYTQKRHPDCRLILEADVNSCQNCGRDFIGPELVYYAPIDNTIVCSGCSEVHKNRQLRIYVKEE